VRLLVFALVQVFAAGSALAATDEERIGELERKLEESVKLINQLSKEVQQLKGESRSPGPAVAAPASTEGLTNKVNDLEQQVSAIANRPEEDHGLNMHGFADVGFTAAGAGHTTGARIGALDFYLTPKFTDRIKALFELNFECCSDGAIGTDLERMQIGYTASDELTVWAGRFHTPFGYWNTAFHHGAQLQTSIKRPQFLDFEDSGGILPVHTVGLWATGSVRTSGGRLGYDLYAGNAPTINLSAPTVAGNCNVVADRTAYDGRPVPFGAPVRGRKSGARWRALCFPRRFLRRQFAPLLRPPATRRPPPMPVPISSPTTAW
jgi:hypothetical protein